MSFAQLAHRAATNERLIHNGMIEKEHTLPCDKDYNAKPENEKKHVFFGTISNDKPVVRVMSLTRQNTYSKNRKEEVEEEEETVHTVYKWSRGGQGKPMNRTTVRIKLAEGLRKIAEERLTVTQIFTRYVESSTLHGFRYSCSETYYIRRFIWACLMILGAVYFIIKLKEGTMVYFEYPFNTKSTVEFVETLKFPAISICAVNGFSRSKIEGSKLEPLCVNNRLPLQKNWQDPGYDIPGVEFVNLMNQTSISIDTLFKECEWIKRDTSHPDVPMNFCHAVNFTSYFNNRGQLCYTLNSGKEGYRLLSVNHEGLIYGYELLFDLNVVDAVKSFSYSGIEVIVHDQSESPAMKNGFLISPGFKTFVRMATHEVCFVR